MEWSVKFYRDDDGHLNIYVKSPDDSDIIECETGQGDGQNGEQLAIRLSTKKIEKNYEEMEEK